MDFNERCCFFVIIVSIIYDNFDFKVSCCQRRNLKTLHVHDLIMIRYVDFIMEMEKIKME